MNEFLSNLLIAVITAAVPTLTGYGIYLIRKVAANAAANTDDIKVRGYISEVEKAVSDAVATTSQTYVNALKNAGDFTKEAQKEAAKKALDACIASLAPATKSFLVQTYGDLTEYLSNKIEAEVLAQKKA